MKQSNQRTFTKKEFVDAMKGWQDMVLDDLLKRIKHDSSPVDPRGIDKTKFVLLSQIQHHFKSVSKETNRSFSKFK